VVDLLLVASNETCHAVFDVVSPMLISHFLLGKGGRARKRKGSHGKKAAAWFP
jgi:hypothetical protein